MGEMKTIEQVKQDWIDNNHVIAAQINSISLGNFLQAAQNWATQMGTQGKATGPKPVAPSGVEAAMVFEPNWNCSFPETGVPVSTVDPSSLLPKYGTDENAVGGPVGGPIPNDPPKFYMHSTDDRKLWYYTTGNRKFTRVQENPFKMYWLEIT